MGYALSPPATNSHNHQRNPMKRQRSDGEMVQGMTFGLSPHAVNHQNLQQNQLKRQRSDAGPVAEVSNLSVKFVYSATDLTVD